MKIGDRWKQVRKEVGWSQALMAEKLGLKVTTISGIENGRNNPSLEKIEKLSQLTEVCIDWILSGRGSKYWLDENDNIKIVDGPSLPAPDRVFTLFDLPEEGDHMPFFIDDGKGRYACDPSVPIDDGCMALVRLEKSFIARVVLDKKSVTLLPLDNPADVQRYKLGKVKLQRLTMRVELL